MTPIPEKHKVFHEHLSTIANKEARIDAINEYAWSLRYSDSKYSFTLAEEASELAHEVFYKKGLAESLRTIGQCFLVISNYTDALKVSLEAREIFQELGDLKGEADTLNTLGGIYNFLGEYEQRLQCNLQCLELRKQAGNEGGVIGTLSNIGDTYIALKDYDNALNYFEQCLAFENINDSNKSIVTHNIGEVWFAQNDWDRAKTYFEASIPLARAANYQSLETVTSNYLAQINTREKNYEAAFKYLDRALEIVKETGDKDGMYHIYKNYADIYEAKGELSKAYDYYKRFHEMKEEVYNDESRRRLKNIQFQYKVKAFQKETEAEKKKNAQLKHAFDKIEHQKNEIAQQNRSITDSIRYAQRIQEAILPPEKMLHDTLKDFFIYYQPKDIVSGDFYWAVRQENKIIFAVADCTGHGVPGALVSIVGNNGLNRVINEFAETRPAAILNQLAGLLQHTFKGEASEVKDGMDMAVCSLDLTTNQLEYAGANNPIYIVAANDTAMSPSAIFYDKEAAHSLYEIKPTKQPIDLFTNNEFKPFTNHTVQLQQGDTIYLFSDGYADQFGGPRGKKFKYKALKEMLLKNHNHPMNKQGELLEQTLEAWKGEFEQVDDICVMGVKV